MTRFIADRAVGPAMVAMLSLLPSLPSTAQDVVVTGRIEVPAESDVYTFEKTDTAVYLLDSRTAQDNVKIRIDDSSGRAVLTDSYLSRIDALPAGEPPPVLVFGPGRYSVTVYTLPGSVSDYQFALRDFADAPSLDSDRSVTIPIEPGNGSVLRRFSVDAGERVRIGPTSSTAAFASVWRLLTPDGREVAALAGHDEWTGILTGSDGYFLAIEGAITNQLPANLSVRIDRLGRTDPERPPESILPRDTMIDGFLNTGARTNWSLNLEHATDLALDVIEATPSIVAELHDQYGRADQPLQLAFNQGWNRWRVDPGEYRLELHSGTGAGRYRFRVLSWDDAPTLDPDREFEVVLGPNGRRHLYRFAVRSGERWYVEPLSPEQPRVDLHITDARLRSRFGTAGDSRRGIRSFDSPGDTELHLSVGVGPLENSPAHTQRFRLGRVPDLSRGIVLGEVVSGTLSGAGSSARFAFELDRPMRVFFDSQSLEPGVSVRIEGPTPMSIPRVNLATVERNGGWGLPGMAREVSQGRHEVVLELPATLHSAPFRFRLVDVLAAPAVLPGVVTPLSPSHPDETQVFKVVPGPSLRSRFVNLGPPGVVGRRAWVDRSAGIVDGSEVDLDTEDVEGVAWSGAGPHFLVITPGIPLAPDPVPYAFRLESPEHLVNAGKIGATEEGALGGGADWHDYLYPLDAPEIMVVEGLASADHMLATLSLPGDLTRFPVLPSATQERIPIHRFLAGTNRVRVASVSGDPGRYAFRVLPLSALSQPIDFGATYSGTLSNSTSLAAFRFEGVFGETIRFPGMGRPGEPSLIEWKVIGPSGRVLDSGSSLSDSRDWILDETGTYYVVLGSLGGAREFSLRLDRVAPPPLTGPVFDLNDGVEGTLDSWSQTNRHRFVLSVPSHLVLLPRRGSVEWGIHSATRWEIPPSRTDAPTLPGVWIGGHWPAGEYQIQVTRGIGPYAFRLINLDEAIPLSESLGFSANLGRAGDLSLRAWTARAGEAYTLTGRVAGVSGFPSLRIRSPSGRVISLSPVLAPPFEQRAFVVPIPTLEESGTHHLVIEREIQFPEPDGLLEVFGSLAPWDAVVMPLALGQRVQGRVASLEPPHTFELTLDEPTTVLVDGIREPHHRLSFLLNGIRPGPDLGFLDSRSLPVFAIEAGIHRVRVHNPFPASDAYEFRLLPLFGGTPLPADGTLAGIRTPPSEIVAFHFEAKAGEDYSLQTTATPSISNPFPILFAPNGAPVATVAADPMNIGAVWRITQDGRHAVVIPGETGIFAPDDSRAYSFRLHKVRPTVPRPLFGSTNLPPTEPILLTTDGASPGHFILLNGAGQTWQIERSPSLNPEVEWSPWLQVQPTTRAENIPFEHAPGPWFYRARRVEDGILP
ncbi:MAG: hypothetical protein AB7O66_18335 [Limisphaerales bacterium]